MHSHAGHEQLANARVGMLEEQASRAGFGRASRAVAGLRFRLDEHETTVRQCLVVPV